MSIYTRRTVIENAREYANHAKDWHQTADQIAAYDSRLAARVRDVADSLSNLSRLCFDIQKTEPKP